MHIRRHVPALFPALALLALCAAPRADAASTCGGFIPAPITTPTNLVQAVSQAQSANCPGADVIDLGGNTITFIAAAFTDGGDNLALPAITTPLSIINGTITRSSATGFRFLVVQGGGDLTLTGMTLSNGGGTGTMDGGAVRVANGNLAVTNTTFLNNTAPDYGGGAILATGIANVTVTDAVFRGNSAGFAGGAINMQMVVGSLTIDRSRFFGNVSTFGGAISKDIHAPLLVRDSLFAGNSAAQGSAILAFQGASTFTLVNVTAVAGGAPAIAANADVTSIVIRNSIAWGAEGANISVPASAVITHTAGQDAPGATISTGYSVEDFFVNPLADPTPANTGLNYNPALYDWTLRPFSPAIDAAQNTYAASTDLAGNTRRVDDSSVADTGNGTAPLVDMGAYERANSSCSASTFPYTLGGASNPIRVANLRTAVYCANLNGVSQDTIDLAGQTVTLSRALADSSALPLITTPIVLANGTIERDSAIGVLNFRLLTNGTAGTLTLADMTLRNGYLPTTPNSNGAAILNQGALTIQRSTLSGNSAYDGGALYNALGATATISRSSLRDNVSHNNGGAAYTAGTLTLANSTVTGSTASGLDAGAVFSDGGSTLMLVNTTISGNSAPTAVDISAGLATYGATTLTNTILANNSPHDCQRSAGTLSFTPGASNIIESNAPSGACGAVGSTHLAVDPQLGALTGAPAYFPLGATSPAVNAGDNGSIGGATLDQPGNTRIQQGRVDLGSVESPFAPIVTTLQFNAATSSAAEAAGLGNLLRVSTSDGNPTTAAATVTVDVSGGTATAGDYNRTGTITVPAGTANNALVSIASGITLVNETLVEPHETLALGLSAPAGAVLGPQASTTHTITNDDIATVNVIDASAIEGNAGTTLTVFVVTFDNPVQGGFSLDYAVGDLTATTADNDYVAATGTLNFTGTAAQAHTILVTVNGDARLEANETFRVSFPSALGAVAPGALVITDTATGNILNDDSAAVTITDVTQAENGSFTFNATLGNATGAPFSVDWALAAGTTDAADYVGGVLPTGGTLDFTGGAGETHTFSIPVLDDSVVEATETFTVAMNNFITAGGFVVDTVDTATGTINDNDSAALTLADVSVLEGDSGNATLQFAVTLDNAVDGGFNVDFATANGTADAGIDYSASSGTLTFAGTAGEIQLIAVSVNGDAVVEADETLTVSLAAVSNAAVTITDTATGTILNDDSATLSITGVAQDEGNTGTSPMTFTVTLDRAVAGGFTVDYASGDGSATLADGDYAAASGTLAFAGNAGESQTFTVDVVGDARFEADETFTVGLAAASNADVDIDATASGTIVNDDAAAGVIVAPLSVATTEAGGSGTFTVVLASEPTAPVVIDLASSDIGEGVVSPTTHTFTAANWTQPQTFTVTGVDDDVMDGNVAYSIVIAPVASTDANFNGIDPADVAATNSDDDSLGIVVTPTSGLVTSEAGGTASFTVALSSQPTGDVTIALSSSDTGEGTVAPLAVTFGPADWDVAQTVTVTGVDDATVDGDVAYSIVTAAAASTDPAYAALDADDVAVTNEDDDTASLRIDDVSLAEGDSGTTAFVFTVTLDGAIDGGVTLGYATADDTATAPADYTAASGTLTFDGNDGETQTITVQVAGDTLVEGAEGFGVVLAAPLPATVTLARAEAIGTIVEEDAGALLSASKRIVQAGTATAPVIYEIVLTNIGGDQGDDPASDELVDVLPAGLALNDATATAGTVVSAGNTVRWNGALAAGAAMTLRIEADVVATAAGQISNQAQIAFDSDGDGSNDADAVSDDPSTAGADATVFVFDGVVEPPIGVAPQVIPALDLRTLLLLALALGLLGAFAVRRHGV